MQMALSVGALSLSAATYLSDLRLACSKGSQPRSTTKTSGKARSPALARATELSSTSVAMAMETDEKSSPTGWLGGAAAGDRGGAGLRFVHQLFQWWRDGKPV